MKIAITGSGRDLGLAIANHYENIQEFRRDELYDINRPEEILNELDEDVEVFINNAQDFTFAQVNMFKAIFDHWRGTNKLIINISSLAPDWAAARGDVQMYDIQKQALDTASKMGFHTKGVDVANLRCSYMDTPWIRKRNIPESKMLKFDEVISAIDYIIVMHKKGVQVGVVELMRDVSV